MARAFRITRLRLNVAVIGRPMLQRNSLRGQFFIGLIVTAFCSLVVMASVQYFRVSSNLNELVSYHLSQVSEQVNSHITQSIYRDIERSSIIKSRPNFKKLLKAALPTPDSLQENSKARVALIDYLNEIKAVSNEIANITITSNVHQLVATTENKAGLRSVINPNNFRTVEFGEQTIGVQFVEADDGFRLVTFEPIYQNNLPDGFVVAYLIIESHLSSITSTIESPTSLSKSQEIVLMYLPNRQGKAKVLVPPRFSEGRRDVNVGLNPFSIISVNEQRQLREFIDYRGVEVVGLVEQLSDFGLAYIIKYDKRDAFTLVEDLKVYAWMSAGLLIILVWVLSYFLSIRILAPFDKVVTTTNKILTSNKTRIETTTGLVELDTLGQSINALADRMRVALNSANLNQEFVLEAILEGVLIIDSHGVILKANPSMEKMAGFESKELIGKNINLLLNEHDQYLIMGLVYKFLNEPDSGQQIQPKQVTINRKNHAEIIASLTLTRLDHATEQLYLLVINDVTEKVNYQRKLEHLALHDSLTDLPKMLLASDRLESAINNAKRNRHKVGVMFVDLDHFKPINDEYGHASGDLVIRVIATRLKESVRESDTVARVGGDEFVIIAPDIQSPQQLVILAQKLRHQVETAIDIGPAKVKVGTSIGISVFPDSSLNKEELLAFADEAMYKVKSEGRSACELHHSCKPRDLEDSTVTPFPQSKM